jgi:hypothetical protein
MAITNAITIILFLIASVSDALVNDEIKDFSGTLGSQYTITRVSIAVRMIN